MFGKQEETGQTRSQSLIQEGVAVRGDIRAEGDLRLEGSIEGTVTTKGRVIVGTTGVVKADLEAAEILVMGKVTGKLVGRRRIELRKGARVEGDLATQALVIEEGVFFQGLSQMSVPGEAAPRTGEKGSGRSQREEHSGAYEKGLLSSTGPKSSGQSLRP